MTNQQKQEQKPRASETAPETARVDKKFYPGLSEEEIQAVDQFPYKLDEAFREIKEDGGYSSKDMCDIFNPCISTPQIVSKICAERGKDKRHVSRNTMVVMRRVFGISIDRLIDGCFQNLPPRQPLKK